MKIGALDQISRERFATSVCKAQKENELSNCKGERPGRRECREEKWGQRFRMEFDYTRQYSRLFYEVNRYLFSILMNRHSEEDKGDMVLEDSLARHNRSYF